MNSWVLRVFAVVVAGTESIRVGSWTVNWCMVVWCAQNVCQDGSIFTRHQALLQWIFRSALCKGPVTHSVLHVTRKQQACSEAENSAIQKRWLQSLSKQSIWKSGRHCTRLRLGLKPKCYSEIIRILNIQYISITCSHFLFLCSWSWVRTRAKWLPWNLLPALARMFLLTVKK